MRLCNKVNSLGKLGPNPSNYLLIVCSDTGSGRFCPSCSCH